MTGECCLVSMYKRNKDIGELSSYIIKSLLSFPGKIYGKIVILICSGGLHRSQLGDELCEF